MTEEPPAPPPVPPDPPPAPAPPAAGPHGFLVQPRVDTLDSVEGLEQVWVHLRPAKGAPARVVKPTDAEFIYVAMDAEGRPVAVSFLRPRGSAAADGLPPPPPDGPKKNPDAPPIPS